MDFFEEANTDSVLSVVLHQLERSRSGHPVVQGYCALSVLELLIQLYSGKLSQRHHAARWVRFCMRFMSLPEETAKEFYLWRNAVAHTFGQYGLDKARGIELRFVYASEGPIFFKASRTVRTVNTYQLLHEVKNVISRYQEALERTPALQENFDRVHRKVGRVTVPAST